MNYKEASDWISETSKDLINCLPPIENLLDMNTKASIEADILNKSNKLLSGLKEKEEFVYDLFKDDDIYSPQKIKKNYLTSMEIVKERLAGSSSWSKKCGENIEAYLTTKIRNEKFNKI